MKEQVLGACDKMNGRWKRREEGGEQDRLNMHAGESEGEDGIKI
jgi:hypothetical protein